VQFCCLSWRVSGTFSHRSSGPFFFTKTFIELKEKLKIVFVLFFLSFHTTKHFIWGVISSPIRRYLEGPGKSTFLVPITITKFRVRTIKPQNVRSVPKRPTSGSIYDIFTDKPVINHCSLFTNEFQIAFPCSFPGIYNRESGI
jgi:hypothetical protein